MCRLALQNDEAMTDLLQTGIISFCVATAGALVSAQLARHLEERKARLAARNDAYVGYFTAIAEAGTAKATNNAQALELAIAKVIAAKMRIALHGSPEVVEAIMEAERLDVQEHINDAYTTVLERMRAESHAPGTPHPRQLAELMRSRKRSQS